MRDCENCKHRVMKVEVGKGTSPEHFWGCECWECEFEPTTKNDLGVDCISREQTQAEIEMNASRYTIAKEHGGMGQVEWSDQLIKVSDAVDIIRHMPSVTPEPQSFKWCKTCKEYDQENHCCHRWSKVIRDTVEEMKQEPFINKPCVSSEVCEHDKNKVLDKIRDQLKSHLRGVEITLEVLVANDPLRIKMEGAKDTLEECLELIDKAETEET